MCRTIACGGARCDRAEPLPGSAASNPERAVTRAEVVAEQARAAFAAEGAVALDRLFTAVKQATTPAERTDAVRTWLDALAGAWTAVVRAIERVHARRIEALDARWRNQVGELLAQVRAARYAEERAALDRLHAMELHLAEEELLSRAPNWGDQLWRACQEADLEDLQRELDEERMRLRKLEARQERRPTPRVGSDIRQTQARIACWRLTLEGQLSTLASTPHTKADGERRCSEAQAAVEAARAAVEAARAASEAMRGPLRV
jgi:DNA repair exonuclease SbcCD ATPase subunit